MDVVRPGCLRVIVTRPAREASDWVLRLQQAGFAAEPLPLIEIAPVDDTRPLVDAWEQLGDYTACLFVSGNAVDFFFRQKFKKKEAAAIAGIGVHATNSIANDQIGSWPQGLRFLAPGPGTVAALVAAGVDRSQIDAPAADAPQFDSEALWAVVGQRDWQGRRVLIVRGQSPVNGDAGASAGLQEGQGRDWISRQWQAAGAQVDLVGVYQRRAPLLDTAQRARAIAAASDGSVWLFSSSEAVANLAHLVQLAHLAHLAEKPTREAMPPINWRGACAIATHPRIAETLRAAGWGRIHESRPALADIEGLLHSIESSQP